MAIEVVPAVVVEPRRPMWAEIGLAVAVAMVLADASVVVLALPDMLTALDATVTGISWVITAFNLAVAIAAVPAAIAALTRPAALARSIGRPASFIRNAISPPRQRPPSKDWSST